MVMSKVTIETPVIVTGVYVYETCAINGVTAVSVKDETGNWINVWKRTTAPNTSMT